MKRLFNFLMLLFCFFGTIQSQTIIFCDDFETGNMKPEWVANPGTNGGIVEVQSGVGHESSFAVAMGRASDGNPTTNSFDLHLNLSGQDQVSMTFWIWDYYDETNAEDGIYFSDNNGATFKKVLDFKPGEWCEQYGQFPPLDVDKLATTQGLTLNNQFVIRFQQRGSYDFYGNTNGFYIDDVCVYDPDLAYASIPFCDNFETGYLSNNWSWSWAGQTTVLSDFPSKPSGYVGVLPGVGVNSSAFAAALGKRCDDGDVSNALDLHLNLAGLTQAELTFWIYDYYDETHVDDGIYFSDDGGQTFKKVFDFKPSDWCEQYGQFPPLDVDKLASIAGLTLSNHFIIRFQQFGSYDFYGNTDGFYIDDVCITVPQLSYKALPFCDDFETGTLNEAWSWSFADATTVLSTFPTRPSNYVGVLTGIGNNNSAFAVAMGKRCDDGNVSNALDLHLNLSGQANVELTFWIYDFFDETHVDDGIYFSDNGGQTFKKVFDFKPTDWCEQYGQFPPLHVDELADYFGLEMTSQFVIRFQQYGSYDFYGNTDGFYIDDVCVYSKAPEYAGLPFCDDFETGTLGEAWAWNYYEPISNNFPNTTRPSNLVEVLPGIGNDSQFAAAMGKRCDDGQATNVMDLYLNLSGQNKVDLSFWLLDYYDETNIEDGIYFSDNGGLSFVKVYSLDPSNLQEEYHQYSLSVDQKANEYGLSLSSQFIVRFQQQGSFDFYGNTDGFYIDDVCVNGNVINPTDEQLVSSSTVRLYPNPAYSTLEITFAPGVKGFSKLKVFDMNGLLKIEQDLSPSLLSYQLDIEYLNEGVYILCFEGVGGIVYKKLVKSCY